MRSPALLLPLLALLALPAAAAERAPDPEAPGLTLTQRLSALLDRVRWEQKRLTALEADFVQERTSEFLAEPERSRGRFSYLRPDRVRWEYLDPKPITLVVDGDRMLTWYRDLGRAERTKVGRVSAQVFRYLDAGSSLESLLGYFSASFSAPSGAGEPYRLELEPRYARIAKRLAGMTIWIDRELYLPVRVRYTEPNGDLTEYRLERLRPNVAIPAERFEIELPPSVEVREVELGGAGGSRPATGG